MGFNSVSIAEVIEHRKTLYKDGEPRYWLDPEQLSSEEVIELIRLKKRAAACSYLGLPPDCDDITLVQAEAAEARRINDAYALFVGEQRTKEEQRTRNLESIFHVFLNNLQHIPEGKVAEILWQ